MDDQLQRLIELQTEQNQLLKKYLWRFRFSLLTLLLLTTGICCSLGFIIYKQQAAQKAIPVATPITVWSSPATPTATYGSGGFLTISGTVNPTPTSAPPTAIPAGAVPTGPEAGQ